MNNREVWNTLSDLAPDENGDPLMDLLIGFVHDDLSKEESQKVEDLIKLESTVRSIYEGVEEFRKTHQPATSDEHKQMFRSYAEKVSLLVERKLKATLTIRNLTNWVTNPD